MPEELITPDDNESQVSEESNDTVAGPRRWTRILPWLILGVLAALAIGYGLYVSLQGTSLLSTPSPARIAFMSDRDGNWEIYIMDRDGSSPLNLTNSSARDGIPLHALGQDRLIFASDLDGQSLDVLSMGLDGNNVSNITQTPDSNEIPIAWSPDAGHVIFASDRGGASEIFLMETSGEGLLNLSERDAAQSFDDWSAETGQLILTIASDLGPALLVTDLDGGAQQTLTDGSYPAGGGHWSPDGQKIAFMAIGPESSALDIFLVDASGGEPVNLTQSPSNESFPLWSPDGSRIAFTSDRDGNSEIYVMDADGGNPTNLTNSLADESVQGDFSWSPDGAQILFHSDRDNDVEVYVMDADGGNQINLTNSPGTDYFSIWVE